MVGRKFEQGSERFGDQVVSSNGGSNSRDDLDLVTSNSAMARVTDRLSWTNAGSEGSTSPDLSIRSRVARSTLMRLGGEKTSSDIADTINATHIPAARVFSDRCTIRIRSCRASINFFRLRATKFKVLAVSTKTLSGCDRPVVPCQWGSGAA